MILNRFLWFTVFSFIVIHRFNEVFDGVVLAYDVEVADKISRILPGIHPYFGVKLKAKLLLFSPKPNMLLGRFPVTVTSPLFLLILSWVRKNVSLTLRVICG